MPAASVAVKSDSTASTGRLVLWSAPDHLDPESTCCRCETAVVRHHDELLLRAIAPDERSGEMKRVQRSKRSGKRFRRTREDSSLEQDEIHGFEPVLYQRRSGRSLPRSTAILEGAVDRSFADTRRQGARSKRSLRETPALRAARLPAHEERAEEEPKNPGRRSPRRTVFEEQRKAVRGPRWRWRQSERARLSRRPSHFEGFIGVVRNDARDRGVAVQHGKRLPAPDFTQVFAQVCFEVRDPYLFHDFIIVI